MFDEEPDIYDRQAIKELAYKLDPECWISYSGKPKKEKQRIDKLRTAALNAAYIQLYGREFP